MFRLISVIAVAATTLLNASARAEMPFTLTQDSIDVALVVTGGEATRDWYAGLLQTEPLGPSTTSDGGQMTRFKVGNGYLKLVEHDPAPPAPFSVEREPGTFIGFSSIGFTTNRAREEISAFGKDPTFPVPYTEERWVHNLNDPEGNRLGFSKGNPWDSGHGLSVRLTVQSIAASAEFYGATLGLEEDSRTESTAQYRVGRSTIGLAKARSEDFPVRTGVRKELAGIRFITFAIDDVDALAERLKAKDVAPVWGPAPPREGSPARLVFFADPDGNWVEFYSITPQPR